jgi:mitotic spindle assembly checkpoint protein MAD1
MRRRGEELQRLSDENERLRARVKLLEEGQTKDLTMLVGQRVEEVSSKEVEGKETLSNLFSSKCNELNSIELREQLKSAEVKRERILEAFKKTSQDFREVCCQLTGYRIDALANNHYRLTPIYAESGDDNLLFLRDSSGNCHLLQTQFSDQLTEFIDLHLSRSALQH